MIRPLLNYTITEDTGPASELSPAGRTVRMVPRERVFILAASKDHAETFTRRWMAEGEGRRRVQDAIYFTRHSQGLFVTEHDCIVELDGFWRNRDYEQIHRLVHHMLAKTGRTWDAIERVTL